jgi:hypothetical protein
MADLKLEAGMTLPGETIIAAILAYAGRVRETMDPVLLKRLDSITVQQLEDMQAIWRELLVKAGIVK